MQAEKAERPDCWEFAMEFLGDPEETQVRAYVAGLELFKTAATSKLAELQREVEAAKRGRAEDVRMLNYRIACQREEIRRLIRDREQGQKRFGTVFEVYHDGSLVRTFDKFQDAYKHAESLYDLGRTTEVFQLFRLNCSWHNKFGMGVARQQEAERLSGGEGGGNGLR